MSSMEKSSQHYPERQEDVAVDTAAEAAASARQAEELEETKSDIDATLADIDDVLEDNAQEFVGNYIQKGGQ